MIQDDEVDLEADETSHIEDTFLTFTLGAEAYAIPVRFVTEIVRLQKTFALPDVPTYVRGVINLRGKVIPLLDVRGRFGMPDTGYTDRTVVVVIEHNDAPTGLVVDAVSEVTEIAPDAIEAQRSLSDEVRASMVSGVAMRGEAVILILDVPTLLHATRVNSAARVSASATGGRA
ncbi:MAG: hypothetical protein RL701_1026 [Pseudomonadota bacterium]|jgi:purine-binding chemotaxis protein CheW